MAEKKPKAGGKDAAEAKAGMSMAQNAIAFVVAGLIAGGVGAFHGMQAKPPAELTATPRRRQGRRREAPSRTKRRNSAGDRYGEPGHAAGRHQSGLAARRLGAPRGDDAVRGQDAAPWRGARRPDFRRHPRLHAHPDLAAEFKASRACSTCARTSTNASPPARRARCANSSSNPWSCNDAQIFPRSGVPFSWPCRCWRSRARRGRKVATSLRR